MLGFVPLTSCDNDVVTEYTADPVANLDALWSILDERYCYFDAKDIDWRGVYNEYNHRLHLKRQWTIYEYFDLMASMLDTLQDGHVNLYSPFNISSCSGWYTDYPTDYYSDIVYSDHYLGTDYRRTSAFQYGYLADSDVGYIRYSSFSNVISATTLAYIAHYFEKADGLIIDVRSNGGGSLEYSKALASCFFKEKTTTGYIRHKLSAAHDDFSDPEPLYTDPATAPYDFSDKPAVVLTNRRCYSATNDFVVRMLQAPNVTVVGGKTGGGGGMPLSQELPNGWMIRFSAVPMYDARMQHTEFGVDPDIEVHISDSDLNTLRDPIIDKAKEILQIKNNE